MRADRQLVELALASSRNQAQELIEAGRVLIRRNGSDQVVKKPSQEISEQDLAHVIVLPSEGPEFVSRGGFKMLGALKQTKLDVSGFFALDVGLSTGGFSDCLLQNGAAKVVGLDVGHGQLSPKLVGDSRLVSLEGINARDLQASQLSQVTKGEKFDLAVIDVSFISLSLVLPEVVRFIKDAGGHVLALVKPQFEVGKGGLGKNGIVKDERLFIEVREKITSLCQDLGLNVEDYFASSIEGSDGNREFFVFARKGIR